MSVAASFGADDLYDGSQYPVMGDYQGRIEALPEKGDWSQNPLLAAQVINIDDSHYRVRILPELNKRCPEYFDTIVEGTGKRLEHSGRDLKFLVEGGKLSGSIKDGKEWIPFSIEKANRTSPTMGAKAPKGAVVLMDGTSMDAWKHADGREATWKLIGDGAMEIEPKKENKDAGGAIFSKQKFSSVKMHLEFRYPVEPGKSGQGRGNSGVFMMCRLGTTDGYELQVLNSYGLEGYWNECGGMYKVMAPMVNAAAPPLEWQTYDIDFTAPQFDKKGNRTADARITVRHNGMLIHNDQALPYFTTHKQEWRLHAQPQQAEHICLQDHSNRIQYRNIWVVPTKG